MRRRYLLPLLVILMFLFPLLQAENSPAKGLDGRQQSMVLVSAYTARGDLDRLRPALDQALDAGLSINEIKEILTHLYAYIGFPRSLNGLQVFMEVLEQRRARGITDTEGKAASPLPPDLDREAYGARVRADLGGQKEIQPPSGVLAFAPVIDTFLKEKRYELKNEVAVKADYYRTPNTEYAVRCQVIEQDSPLIDLTVTVPTEAEAETIVNNWTMKNQEIYALVMSTLL